jgi:XTP/dITP diphosphohydrolase
MKTPPPEPQSDSPGAHFERLVAIMRDLRTDCPWDREQTFESIRHLSLEEVHELSDAILAQDWDSVRGELGDLLLHVVFYSQLGSERADADGRFDVVDVLRGIAAKLIRRHPHVYGDTQATDSQTVIQNWEAIKQQEGDSIKKKSVLAGVPKGLPALLQAYRMQEKAAGVGFDWPEVEPVRQKVLEEWDELHRDLAAGPDRLPQAEAELGDLFFALVNYARHLGLNPEDALAQANRKFKHRFEAVETAADAAGHSLRELSLEQLDAYWEQAKAAERDA